MDKFYSLASMVDWEYMPKSFWSDPIGYVKYEWAEMVNNLWLFIETTSDTFTLFAVSFLIVAQVFGFDTAKRYRGLVIVSWLFVQFFIVMRGE